MEINSNYNMNYSITIDDYETTLDSIRYLFKQMINNPKVREIRYLLRG